MSISHVFGLLAPGAGTGVSASTLPWLNTKDPHWHQPASVFHLTIARFLGGSVQVNAMLLSNSVHTSQLYAIEYLHFLREDHQGWRIQATLEDTAVHVSTKDGDWEIQTTTECDTSELRDELPRRLSHHDVMLDIKVSDSVPCFSTKTTS